MSLQKAIGSQALSALASDIKASIALKADQSDTYTKEEVDDKIAGNLPEKSASGAIATFETNYAGKLKSLSTTIVAKGGGGTPSTPIPIVGYSEVNLTRHGINQWNEEPEGGVYQTANGEPASDANSWRSKDFIRVTPNTSYHFHKGGNQNIVVLYYYEDDGTYINYQWVNANVSDDFNFTTPANCAYMHFTLYNAASGYGLTYNYDISVSYPNTETQYIPYNGQTITIALGQTVYGGRLYFENGWKCDVTWVTVDLGSLTYTKTTAGDYTLFWANITDKAQNTNSLCESYKNSNNGRDSLLNNEYGTYNLASLKNTIAIRDDAKASFSEADFKTAMNGIMFAYELATPFTIDLSSSDMLDAVVGINNVFSDCGNTELEYYYKVTELANLDDVNVSNPVNGQVLKYDSASDKWINATGGGSTPWTDVTGTLTAGQTSITLSNPAITTSSTLDYYTDTFGVNPTSVSVANGSVTLTFEAQASNLGVKVRVS